LWAARAVAAVSYVKHFFESLMNGDEKWFVCLLNLVELFTITVFVHTVGIADHHCLNFLFLCT
jgi:hypothetical protein